MCVSFMGDLDICARWVIHHDLIVDTVMKSNQFSQYFVRFCTFDRIKVTFSHNETQLGKTNRKNDRTSNTE